MLADLLACRKCIILRYTSGMRNRAGPIHDAWPYGHDAPEHLHPSAAAAATGQERGKSSGRCSDREVTVAPLSAGYRIEAAAQSVRRRIATW
jgi:hypothetical protein